MTQQQDVNPELIAAIVAAIQQQNESVPPPIESNPEMDSIDQKTKARKQEIYQSPKLAIWFDANEIEPKNHFAYHYKTPRRLILLVNVGKEKTADGKSLKNSEINLELKPGANFGIPKALYDQVKAENRWFADYERKEIVVPFEAETPELSHKISGYSDRAISEFVKRTDSTDTLRDWLKEIKSIAATEMINERLKDLNRELE